MSDQPEQPTPPDGEPTETVTAGAKPPMRVPAHGKGRIYVAGVKGNAGGGRLPSTVLQKLCILGDQTVDELLARVADEKLRAKMSVDTLRLILDAVCPYFLARRHEVAGVDGGAIVLQVDAVRAAAAESFRQRMERIRVIPGPTSE